MQQRTIATSREAIYKRPTELGVVQPGSHKSQPKHRLIHTKALAGFALLICPFDEYIPAEFSLFVPACGDAHLKTEGFVPQWSIAAAEHFVQTMVEECRSAANSRESARGNVQLSCFDTCDNFANQTVLKRICHPLSCVCAEQKW